MNKLASVFESYVTTAKLCHQDPLSLSSNEDRLGLMVDSESLSTGKPGEGQIGISSSCERIVLRKGILDSASRLTIYKSKSREVLSFANPQLVLPI
ncbi:unnamed protein product [Caretta caretta]